MGFFDRCKKKPDEPGAQPATAQPPTGAGQGSALPNEAGEAAPQQSWFGKLRSALKKTNDLLNTDIRDLFKREGRLVDEEFLRELFAILVKTDMGTGPAARIRDRIGTDFRARVVHMDDVLASVKDEIRQILQQPESAQGGIHFAASGP